MKHRTLQRREIAGTARFLTFCCHRRLALFRNDAIKDKFVDRLTRTAAELDVNVLAWVVMPEHVHLIVYAATDAITMKKFTHALKRPFALEVLNRWRALDARILSKLIHANGHRFWQTGGGYDRNVLGRELQEKIRYVHDNPVRRKLVDRPAAYRWSSAAVYEGAACIGPRIAFELLASG